MSNSSIIQRLKEAHITLRKRRAAVGYSNFSPTSRFELTVLTSLLGTMELEAKNANLTLDEYPEVDVIKSIQKFIKNSGEMAGLSNEPVVQERSAAEIALLTTFLPKQLTPDEIADIIGELILDPETQGIGSIMKAFKAKYEGQYNPKLVNETAKRMVNI